MAKTGEAKRMYDSDVPHFEQCPFCDRVFRTHVGPVAYTALRGPPLSDLEQHLVTDHHKVKLRKGSNYKWVDESEVARGVYRPTTGGPGRVPKSSRSSRH